MKHIQKFDDIDEKASQISSVRNKIWKDVVAELPDLAGKKWKEDTTLPGNYLLDDVLPQISFDATGENGHGTGFHVASQNGNVSYIAASTSSTAIVKAIRKAIFAAMEEHGEAGDALADLVDMFGKNLSKEWIDNWFNNSKNKKS